MEGQRDPKREDVCTWEDEGGSVTPAAADRPQRRRPDARGPPHLERDVGDASSGLLPGPPKPGVDQSDARQRALTQSGSRVLSSDRATVFGLWAMPLRQVCHAPLHGRRVGFSERDGPAGCR